MPGVALLIGRTSRVNQSVATYSSEEFKMLLARYHGIPSDENLHVKWFLDDIAALSVMENCKSWSHLKKTQETLSPTISVWRQEVSKVFSRGSMPCDVSPR